VVAPVRLRQRHTICVGRRNNEDTLQFDVTLNENVACDRGPCGAYRWLRRRGSGWPRDAALCQQVAGRHGVLYRQLSSMRGGRRSLVSRNNWRFIKLGIQWESG
jgi:hypothetical protein